jgi:hypothetical protein
MMRNKKNKTVSVAEVNTLLRELEQVAKDASKRYNGNEEVNYSYMNGLLVGALKYITTLAATGGTPEEVRDALKYETTLISNYNRQPQTTWSFDNTKLSLV